MFGTVIGTIGGLGVSLGMTYVHCRLLKEGHELGQARKQRGKCYWGDPPPNPVTLAIGLLFATAWMFIWAALPVFVVLALFGIRI
ncbi:MAG: hypothetical protein JJU08_10690 [Rhodobacteraceae bacterium]|nr:hypothetical protein [Paracoccaceae bacterium]